MNKLSDDAIGSSIGHLGEKLFTRLTLADPQNFAKKAKFGRFTRNRKQQLKTPDGLTCFSVSSHLLMATREDPVRSLRATIASLI